jgi:asparagine synthase (glutamine-hydrolysing)
MRTAARIAPPHMTRRLVGTFAAGGRPGVARGLGGALAPYDPQILACGDLRLAHSGTPVHAGDPVCVLDGFIDNAEELRAALGVPPSAPVEVLLARGYRRWGRELPARLRGDFVLVAWDRERREGLLARDQLGVRSLYLHDTGGGVCFATEMRDLLALLPRRPSPDEAGVAHWITMRGRPGSGTLYEGVRRLNPGSMLLLCEQGVREERYWAPRFVEPLALRGPELAERVRGVIGDAVERRLDADAITGVMMSGGLDSSSVAALAAERTHAGGVAAFSAEFPEHPAVDESALIAGLREELALGGATARVYPGGLLAGALEWIDAWKLPLTSWGEFWAGPLLRNAASMGVRTMLGGDGGDELFDCRAYLMADLVRAGRVRETLALAHELPGAGDDPPRRALLLAAWRYGLLGALPRPPHALSRRLRERSELPRWLRAGAARGVRASNDPLAWKRLEGPRWWAFDAHTLTRGVEELGLFENHRRRAALAGLESRHPLFDLDLLELGLRQPPRATFDRVFDRPVLRASMAGVVPEAIRERPVKALFDSLLVDSLTGPDREACRRLLSDPAARLGEYVEVGKLRRALLEGTPGQARGGEFRWMYQVWRLATAELWLRSQEQPDVRRLASELRCSAPRVSVRGVPASGEQPGAGARPFSHPFVFPP